MDDATHVVLLTDGGSPVELSTVARLRELGVEQLVSTDEGLRRSFAAARASRSGG